MSVKTARRTTSAREMPSIEATVSMSCASGREAVKLTGYATRLEVGVFHGGLLGVWAE